MEDIRQTGPVGLKGLKGLNRQQNKEQIPTDNSFLSRLKRTRLQGQSPENATLEFKESSVSDTGLQAMNYDYGNSRYDKDVTESQMSNLNEVRGQNQPWYWQLTNALGKGITQAATTFVDGTAGLLLGVGEAIGYGLSGYNASSSFSRIFHNEISDSINEFNKYMEEVLPNYRTDEERNNEWYQNLGTMNFWADSILKNIGFTVGSVYSGNAWNMALKGVGLLKNASTFGAKITGSLLSSVNEGRQEANQNSTDMLELDKQKIYDARNRNYQEIDNLYKQRYNEIISSEMSNNQKQANLALLNQDIKKRRVEINNTTNALLKDAIDRSNQAGLLDLALNIPLLTYTDYRTYGKIFASSFKGARQQAKKEGIGLFNQFRKNANKAILNEENEVTNRIIKKDGKYLWNKITKKDNLLNIGKIALSEGNEEMSQQMAANLSGEYFQPDDTDAYYKAMRNHKSNVDTNDLMTAIVNGFNSSYGDKEQWEQFVAGAINGLIGVPTFGRRANSTANTYLGRNKMIGISGGFFGERAMRNEYNRQGSDIVDRMNKLVTDIQDKKKLMAQSKSFIDAMNGYQEADNKFEFENANDNDTFNLYTSFLQAGKEDDLKELLNQQFENFTDEQLNEIKDFTSFLKDEWLDKDKNLTDDGKKEMRKKLIERRDNLLSQFEDYKKALSIIKNMSDIPEEHQNEMAWLLWKGNRFRKRVNEILDKPENKLSIQGVIDAIALYTNELRNESTRKEQYEEEDEKGNKVTKEREINNKEIMELIEQADAIHNLLVALKDGKDEAIALLADKKNKDLLDYLSSEDFYKSIKDYDSNNYINYTNTINSLVDTYKLTTAIKSFNEKLEEYTKNPQNIDKAHKRIDDEEKEKEDLENNTINKDKLENSSVSDLTTDDSFDIEEALSKFVNDENTDENIDDETKNKLKEAKKIIDFYKKALDKLNKQLANKEITQQQYDIQKAALDKSKQLSESYKEFLDLNTESYNDTESINIDDLQDFLNKKNQEKQSKEHKDLNDDELQSLAEEYKQQQIDKAKENLKHMQEEFAEEDPTEIPTIDTSTKPILSIINSNDADSSTTQSTQDQKKEEEKRKNKEKLLNSKDKQELINQLVNHIINIYNLQNAPEIVQTQLKRILDKLYNYANKQAKNETKQQNTQNYLGIALNAIQKTVSYNKLKVTISDIDNLLTKVYPILHQFVQNNLQKNINNKWLVWELDHITLEDKKKDKKNYEEWKKWYENNKSISKVNDKGVTITDTNIETKEEETEIQDKEDTETKEETIDEEPITPDITEKDIEITNNSIETSLGTIQDITFDFMYPTTTEYSRFGDRTKPYHENVKDEELKKRYKTLHDFMEQHEVFKNANELSVGSVIHFGFSKSLNQSLGNEMVVLMFDENGKIVGDLPTMKDKNFVKIKGLAEITKKAFDTLNVSKDNIEDIVMIDGLESHVKKMMIGRPNYNNERLNLNTIFNNDFYLYIDNNKTENSEQLNVLKFLNIKSGQPFVLIKTVGNKYYPVPFIMRKFDIVHDKTILSTTLGLAVMDVLNTIVDVKNDEDCLRLKNDLLRYLAIPSLHINIIDGKLNIKIQRTTDSHPYTMLNMDLNELTEDKRKQIALKVAQNLSGQDGINFQIKIKNGINKGEIQLSNGKKISYNQAIGEIAEVNLPKGTNHTINDWFIINPIENGKEIKEIPLKIKKQNPNVHKAEQEVDKSIENNNIFTYKNNDITYEFNIKTKEIHVYNKDGDVIKQPVSNLIKMDLYTKAYKLNGIIKTPFGYYNTDTHKEVGKIDYLKYRLYDDLIAYSSFVYYSNKEENIISNIYILTELLKNYDKDKEYKIIGIEQLDGKCQYKIVNSNYNRLNYLFDEYFNNQQNINDLLKIDKRLDKYKDDLLNLGIDGLIDDKTEKEINDILNEVGYKPYLSINENDKWNISDNINQDINNNQNNENKEENKEITVDDVIKTLNKRSCKFNTKQKKILLNIKDKELLKKLYELENTSKLKQLLTLFNTLKINSKTDEIEKTFNKLFDDTLNRDENIVKQEDKVLWNKEKEINRVTKMLPQLEKENAIRLVDSIENMNGNATIYGQFKNGVLYLRKDTIRGTLYHEAFHFVSQSLLTGEELSDLYSLARDRYGRFSNLELEENLAEDFRRYMQKEESFKGFFVKYWRKLKNFINTIIGNTHTIDKLFFDISRGSYANRIQHESNRILNRADEITNKEEIKKRIEESNIIFGHPAIGKSYYVNHLDDIIDWDNEINKKRNNFVARRVKELNPNATNEELFNLQMEYLAKADDEKYIEFLNNEWERITEKARNENKKIFISSLPILRLHKDDFDLFINMSKNEFVNRDINRGHDKIRAQEWKANIDKELSTVDSSKVVSTDNYLANIMGLRNPDLIEDSKLFLSNFGITLQDVSKYKGPIPLFDALNRVINFRNKNDITEGVGEAIAFMMQHDDKLEQLMFYHYIDPKSIKRSLRKRGNFDIKLASYQRNQLKYNKDKLLKEIGNEIAKELRNIYDINSKEDKENNSFISTLREIIFNFLDKLTTPVRLKFNSLFNYPSKLARAVYDNDKSVIVNNNIKPKTNVEGERVNIEKAFKENPYEENITSILNKHGISLAGSASIALAGTLYRPVENPLHDLDFNAMDKTKEEIEKVLKEEFENYIQTQYIATPNAPTNTYSYLIMDRPFKVVKTMEGIGKFKDILDAKTGKLIGKKIGSDLILEKGVKGKLLDFFVNANGQKSFNNFKVNLNNKEYLISSEKNAFKAKIDWQRDKDIFDFNRFVPNKDIDTNEIIQYYRNKNMILDDEQIQYLNDRKISIDDYLRMSDEEKETLWKCM